MAPAFSLYAYPIGWDDTVKCSFEELGGSGVELVIAIFENV